MNREDELAKVGFIQRIKKLALENWTKLSDQQKAFVKRVWGLLTYKWRWQIAMNVPYLALFVLDRTFPAVHKFDLALVASITSRLPIPASISSLIGLS